MWAGIAKVLETGLAPKSLRHHVVDVECLGSDDLRGVTGTPAFCINGRLVSGAQPLESLARVIEDELARAR